MKRYAITLGLLFIVGIASFLAIRDTALTWRLQVVSHKITGNLAEIAWPELIEMLMPGSGFYLEELAELPNPYAVVRNPFISAADRQQGSQLFGLHCGGCHGLNGRGGKAPDLIQRKLGNGDSDFALYKTIQNGIDDTTMPAVELESKERWQIVGFLTGNRGQQSESQLSVGKPRSDQASIDVSGQRIEASRTEPWNWLTYSGSYSGQRFSTLKEIDRSNVAELKLAWVAQFNTTEFIESSPIIVDGVLYMTSPTSQVWAFDASTGRSLWNYQREISADVPACCGRVNRGVAIYGDTIYVGTLDAYLVALDAGTGELKWEVKIAEFSEGYSVTVAPLAVRDKIVIGVSGGEFGIRGFLDAYDAETGERAWRFYTVPAPADFGADTWQDDAWKTGGGPTWVTGSYDPDLNLLYWGVGNPAPDFDAGARPGDNLFTNSVIALDIDSGELAWHYQFTPADEHDYDSNQVPVLADLQIDGEPRKLMLWANRNGFYYVLDRVTGEFLHASAFAKQTWAIEIDPTGRPVRNKQASPSSKGTLVWPGSSGATNWGSPSFNPDANIFYVGHIEMPSVFFKNSIEAGREHRPGVEFLGSGTMLRGEQLSTGIRALSALDGKLIWEHRMQPRERGGQVGGVLSTAGQLVFFGDFTTFYAFAARSGEKLWETNLGGRINASPATFAVNDRQFIFIPAGNAAYVFSLGPDLKTAGKH